MRIVHVIAPGPLAGAERLVAAGTAALAADGHDVTVHVLRETRAPEHADALLGVLDPRVSAETSDVRGRFDMRPVVDVWRHRHADVVHAHGYKATLATAALPRPAAARVVTHHGNTDHTAQVRRYAQWMTMAYRRFDAVFSVSSATAEGLRGGPPVHVVDNCLSLSIQDALPGPGPAAELRLVYLGRLSREKGLDVLLAALARVAGVTLTVVGEGREEDRLRQQTRTLGLSERVRFAGFQQDVTPWLGASDALALPSRTEGLPMALVEAMAAGRPVLATRVGGVPDALDRWGAGVLVAPDDVDQMEVALRQLAAGRDGFAAEARARAVAVRAHFSGERWAAETLAAYRATVAARR